MASGDAHDEPASGAWKVTTSTSVYLIDLDEMTAARLPGEELIELDGPPSLTLSGTCVRLDALPLNAVPSLRVGETILLWMQNNGVPTFQLTTAVRAVCRLWRA